jgi:hypothetical protein
MFDQDQPLAFNKDVEEWPARSRWLRMRFAADDMQRRLDGEDGPLHEGDSEEAQEALREKADDFGDCFGPF